MISGSTPTLNCTDGAHGEDGQGREETELRSATARMLVGMIHAYQLARAGRPTGCRFLPSCSEYAVVSIDRHGPLRGIWLAAHRIARCNPWGGHGIDPVPERRAR